MYILFVHRYFRLFDKLDTGAANRNTMFVKALSQLGHVDIISFYGEPLVPNIDNCEVVFNKTVSKNRKIDKIIKIVRLFFTPWLPYGYYDYNKECLKVVEKQLHNKKYDYIACRYISTAIICGLEKYANKLIIDVDDNPANVYRNILNSGNSRFFWKKWLMTWKIMFVGFMTQRYLNQCKCSFFSNILEPPSDKSIFLHNVSAVSKILPALKDKAPNIILTVGFLDYSPNRDGVIHFVENIFPQIKEKVQDVVFYIIGKSKDESLLNYLNGIDGVKTLGYVEDLLLAYNECRVVVIPVYQGSGTCVKFAEGLMMNRPIVSTPVGARGFGNICKDGEHFVLAKSDEEFAEGVIKLLKSINYSREIATNAYKVGVANLSQERFYEIVANAVKNKMN